MKEFVSSQRTPNDSTVVHINCRNEIIGSQLQKEPNSCDIQSESEFELLSGISSIFISTAFPGIEVNIYKDSRIFDIHLTYNTKCVLVFHIWRSLYGHFSRLKTDSEYVEHIEKCVQNCDYRLAFGGVTVERLVSTETTTSCKSDKSVDYVCCLTFSGSNLKAFSYVIDFSDCHLEQRLESISEELKVDSIETETICFVFDQNIRQTIRDLRRHLSPSIKLIGCAGIGHGINSIKTDDSSVRDKSLFFRKRKSILVAIQLQKAFE